MPNASSSMPSATPIVTGKFKVGDRVRMVKPVDGYMAAVECVVETIAHDPFFQYGYTLRINAEGKDTWAVPESAIELVKKEPEKKVKATKNNSVMVKLERRANGKTYFSFQVPNKITELYKSRSQEVVTSKSWVGVKFYSIPALITDERYKEKLKSYNLFDNFGDAFVKIEGGSYRLNIAWIRAQDGVGEFEVKNELGHSELNMLVKNMLEFLKNYFEDYFREFSIKGQLTIDF